MQNHNVAVEDVFNGNVQKQTLNFVFFGMQEIGAD
jgi:hypothetical protein